METSSIEAEEGFVEFYWGAIRAIHSGCPFMELSEKVMSMIRPQMLRNVPMEDGAIPFVTQLPQYFSVRDLRNITGDIKGMKLTAIHPDISRNRTLIMGLSYDELIHDVLTRKEFERMGTGNLYSQAKFEVLPVVTIDRDDLFIAEKLIKEKAETLGGDAYLDTIGRVASFQDYMNQQEAFNPVPTSIPGLSVAEAAILEAAIGFGYYENPRKLNQEELAKRIGMAKSTLSAQLRTIENRIVNNSLFQT